MSHGEIITHLSREEALTLVTALSGDPDDNWTYRAVQRHEGAHGWFVEAHDEDGEFVDYL